MNDKSKEQSNINQTSNDSQTEVKAEKDILSPTKNDIPKSTDNKQEDKVIDVGKKIKDGQYVCPNCGSSQIEPNPKTGKLKCAYCACEFDGKKVENTVKDLSKLKGRVRGSGTSNIKADAKDVVTLRCGGCGAEVVIDTANAPHARCHWCRSILSINSQIDNGAIPDVILPFKEKKEEAQEKINTFVKKRGFFANPTFKKEFTTENIMGVYFPYLLVDANCHANYKGQGEHLVRRYTIGSGDNRKTYYDADLYNVQREFDIYVEGLSVESNSTRLDKTSDTKTNNIINSIMPFDTENCIQYQSNYLVGYTSERRDVNIDDIEPHVNNQLKDIAKFSANEEAKFYDRGIRWDFQDLKVIGTQWLSAYLPVWLYSYQEVKGEKKILHYVAVNARTGETMGSVPINFPLLIGISAIIEVICAILGIILFLFTSTGSSDDDNNTIFLLLFAGGFIFYGAMYLRYRNSDARHVYEKETKKQVLNMKKDDSLVEHKKRLRNSSMEGRNENTLEGEFLKNSNIIKNVADTVQNNINEESD